jgi:hypothetical protein
MKQEERNRLLEILAYWHKIEFFIPFNLNEVIINAEGWQINWVYANSLQNAHDSLPVPSIPHRYETTGYNLFLGILEKASVSAICDEILTSQSSFHDNFDQFENSERGDPEGRSCFAKLQLSKDFEPQLESISVSTMPWAVGVLRQHGLKALSYDSFLAAKLQLADALKNFQAERSARASEEAESSKRWQLTASDLIGLHELFCDWTGYTPDSQQPIAMIELKAKMRKPRTQSPTQETPIEKAKSKSAEAPAADDIDEGPELQSAHFFGRDFGVVAHRPVKQSNRR